MRTRNPCALVKLPMPQKCRYESCQCGPQYQNGHHVSATIVIYTQNIVLISICVNFYFVNTISGLLKALRIVTLSPESKHGRPSSARVAVQARSYASGVTVWILFHDEFVTRLSGAVHRVHSQACFTNLSIGVCQNFSHTIRMDQKPPTPDAYRRFAVYAAPAPGCPIGTFGNAWLGRDPETGHQLSYPSTLGYADAEIARMTSQPARYGFHATLKPPFRLNNWITPALLFEAIHELTSILEPVPIGKMKIEAIGTFAALVPQSTPQKLTRLAATLVEKLDAFRAPLTTDELARRRQTKLTARQDALLQQWGYPYVMDEFRFHLTLSNSLAPKDLAPLISALKQLAPLRNYNYCIEDIAVFGEPADGSYFRLLKRFPLSGKNG